MKNLMLILVLLLCSSCIVERKLEPMQYHLWYSQDDFNLRQATLYPELYATKGDYVIPYTYATKDPNECYCDMFDDAVYLGVGFKYKEVYRNIHIKYKGRLVPLFPGVTRIEQK